MNRELIVSVRGRPVRPARMFRRARSALVLTFGLLAIAVCAGPIRAEWQSFGTGDGLADDTVMAIVEDSSQNLWFGTNDGVSRYDGVNWTTYTTEDGLTNNGVVAILEDSSGDLWFATWKGGVSRYDGVNWETYTTDDGLASDKVDEIIEDTSGNLWFATDDGVSRYDGVSWTTYTTADGLAGDSVFAVLEDSAGDMWFGTEGYGVSRYDGVSWMTYTTDDGLADNTVLTIVEDSSGSLWFGTNGGLSHYDGVSWTTYTMADGLAGDASRAIIEDSTGDLWYASFWNPGGVSRYDGMKWTTYTTDDGLVSEHVVSLLEDSSGNLWFGTWGGLSRYDGVSWATYAIADGLTHNEVFAIEEDSSRNLWFGTEGGGASCYNGVSWTTYTGDDGLAGNRVRAIAEDSSGDLWFGTWHFGVSRYDGSVWTTYTTADGLADSTVTAITEDNSGNLWFGTPAGVSQYDGSTWTTYTTADGLAGDSVRAIVEDSSGSLWFGTPDGVSQYDGVDWMTYTTDDGLAGNDVTAIAEDSSGSLWFGTYGGGVSRYDGAGWTTYTAADGLARDEVLAIIVDGTGDLWFGTEDGGVSRYSGVSWTTYTTSTWVNGLAADAVYAIIEDRSGDLWFGFGPSGCGVSVHGPDRAAPQTVISGEPPQLTASRTQTIVFAAAFGESWGIRFSHSFDGAPWSEWMSTGFWMGSGLSDGEHVFEVTARDEVGNVDSTQAIAAFEVDATPPVPVISTPAFDEAVGDSISILGTATDPRFGEYSVDVRTAWSEDWEQLAASGSSVSEGVLGGWNTTLVPDGDYELRLSVMDTLGLTGTDLVRVEVDNEPPWAWETSPVTISASSGGDVFSADNHVHVYFPPHALANDASVSLAPADEGSVPDTLAGGAVSVSEGYEVSWDDIELGKQATLRMALTEDGEERAPRSVLALYVLAEGQDWRRIGGTVSPDGASISAAIEFEGTYAVFSDSGGSGSGGGLSAVSFTPRVFSPSGNFADTEVAISFTLGRAGPVTAKVYNRAGRLVDELVSRLQMNAGANVVRWDGRSGDGDEIPDGLYLVTVEALGETQVRLLRLSGDSGVRGGRHIVMRRDRQPVVRAPRTRLSTLPPVLMAVLCTLAVCAGPAWAEWQSFRTGDGLADNFVPAILEDGSGSLWFGTDAGVSCYDGLSWTTYTTEDGLADNSVYTIIEDGSGDLWFGTPGGVSRYDGAGWTTYTADAGAPVYVVAIIEDSSGSLWFGTYGGGVSCYDGASWTTYTIESGLADNSVYAIIEDSSGNLWFGTGGGVSRYDGVSWTTYTAGDGLAGDRVRAVTEDGSGDLWFGTESDGVSRYDGVGWTTYTTDDGLASNNAGAIIEDGSGNLWLGTDGGVSRYDGVSWTTYTTESGLADNHVLAIIEDGSGNLWFGTAFGGASRYDGVSWTTYTTESGLADNWVSAIAESGSGTLWFGTAKGGVSRYDGIGWTTYTTDDGLAGNSLYAIIEDGSGNLWFGTSRGVSRRDGVSWTTYTTEDGLAHNCVLAIIEDSSGDLWFGTAGGGVSRYDGAIWTTYTTEDGLAHNYVGAIVEDSSGDLWFGTSGMGVSCYDGVNWTTYTTADGLASDDVHAIIEDGSGSLWFGTYTEDDVGGVSRYDGVSWTTYTIEDGLGDGYVGAIHEDSSGNLWFGTGHSGVSCYDGLSWTTYATEDGLADNFVLAIIEDSSGNLWFGTQQGLSAHEPDRVAPQTVIWLRPPPVTPGRTQTIPFTVAYGEYGGIRFSHSFDGSAWSDWLLMNAWTGDGLSDGEHTFRVRARDAVGNVDSTPATCIFVVDATPPAPVISSPVFAGAVRDSVAVQGTAADQRFENYSIEVRPAGTPSWEFLVGSSSPVTDGVLGDWNTTLVSDGDYELRLSVSDTLGLTGTDLVRVVVDNEPPWAWETSPVAVSVSTGGDVYTTNREVHLYFPPRALARDALVRVVQADEGSVPDTLGGGAELVFPGYEISWEGADLTKQATLGMTLGERAGARDPDGVLALYVVTEEQNWQRLGGTVGSDGASISAAIELEGTYAVFSDSGGSVSGGGLSAVSFTPRVFSPSGSFADTEVAISFTLGRSGAVTAKVYNRAGRLVDELVSRFQMNAGANVVRWDGRDGDGAEVPDGLYLVAVEVLGERQVQTLAVVR